MYKCDICRESFDKESHALECEFNHTKKRLANKLLEENFNLDYINWMCGFNWKLSEDMKKVTKNNCFIISYWQCCEKPAYQIVEIDHKGNVFLWGVGSWNGGFGGWKKINDDDLKNPYPEEALYRHHED